MGSSVAKDNANEQLTDLTKDLSPGLIIDVEIESQMKPRPRFRTTLIGLRPGSYLILHPADKHHSHFYTGAYVVIRFVANGHVVAYKAQILSVLSHPDKIVFCRYPKASEIGVHRLRSEQRVTTRMPVRIKNASSKQTISGLIMDISLRGCFVQTPSVENLGVKQGDVISLSMPFLTLESQAVNLEGTVRNVRLGETNTGLGIEFAKPAEQLMEILQLN